MRGDGYSDGGPEWCQLCEDWTGMGCTCEEEERKERRRLDKLKDTLRDEIDAYHQERDSSPGDWRDAHIG